MNKKIFFSLFLLLPLFSSCNNNFEFKDVNIKGNNDSVSILASKYKAKVGETVNFKIFKSSYGYIYKLKINDITLDEEKTKSMNEFKVKMTNEGINISLTPGSSMYSIEVNYEYVKIFEGITYDYSDCIVDGYYESIISEEEYNLRNYKIYTFIIVAYEGYYIKDFKINNKSYYDYLIFKYEDKSVAKIYIPLYEIVTLSATAELIK